MKNYKAHIEIDNLDIPHLLKKLKLWFINFPKKKTPIIVDSVTDEFCKTFKGEIIPVFKNYVIWKREETISHSFYEANIMLTQSANDSI